MKWSFSRIESFNTCPYKFYLSYIDKCKDTDKFYASYGTYMHKIIEDYYNGDLKREDMVTRFLSDFSKDVKGKRPSSKIVKSYIQKGKEYLENFEPFPYELVEVEKRVDFDLHGYRFIGYIDFLGKDGDDFIVIDNKSRDLKPRSGRKVPTKKDKELDEMIRQLYLYAGAVKQEYGKFPTKLCFNCFKAHVFIEEPFKEEAYNEAVEWALNSIEEIKKTTDFYPNQDYFFCTHICGVNKDCVYDEMVRKERQRKFYK